MKHNKEEQEAAQDELSAMMEARLDSAASNVDKPIPEIRGNKPQWLVGYLNGDIFGHIGYGYGETIEEAIEGVVPRWLDGKTANDPQPNGWAYYAAIPVWAIGVASVDRKLIATSRRHNIHNQRMS